MKQLKPLQLAFTFIGCFLGAGFVSGQELWQFFGAFGAKGFLGAALASVLLCFFAAILMIITRRTGIADMEKVIFWREAPVLQAIFGVIEIVFMFCIYIVMIAGAGSLAEQLTGLGWMKLVFSALFCAALTAVSLKGVNGLVRIFSKVMPALTFMAIAISAAAVFRADGLSFPAGSNNNPLISNWGTAAFTYLSYNFLCAIGVIAPLGKMVRNARSIVIGSALGCAVLFAISAAILSAVATMPETAQTELPMIALCANMHPILEYIYALLLFCAMFGASMSVFVPIPEFFCRFEKIRPHRLPFAFALSFVAWLGSNLGFSKLIGTVYPVFGYIGAAVLVLIIIHFFKTNKSATEVKQ